MVLPLVVERIVNSGRSVGDNRILSNAVVNMALVWAQEVVPVAAVYDRRILQERALVPPKRWRRRMLAIPS
jgi:hypothetical protein